MASAHLKARLRRHMESMVEERQLHECFLMTQILETPARSTFVDQTLTQAIEETEALMKRLKKLFNKPVFNFGKMDELALALVHCVGGIGSHRLIDATQVLRHLVWINNKERCTSIFSEVCELYEPLQSRFKTIVELVDQILEIEDED